MIRRPHASAIACAVILCAACSKPPRQVKAAALRAVPEAVPLTQPEPPSRFPSAILQGGGATPVSNAIPEAASAGSGGLPWVPMGIAKMRSSFHLADCHVYAVVRPQENGTHGLFGGGGRNWDNFVQFTRNADGTMGFNSENRKGGASRFSMNPADVPQINTPWLLEFHPKGGKTAVWVNGRKAGELNSDIDATWFGAGYATTPFRGQFGEIRVFPELSDDMIDSVRLLLTSWWGLPDAAKEAFPAGFRHDPSLLGPGCSGASSGELAASTAEPLRSPVYLAAGPVSPPRVDGLPAGITAAVGRTWWIHAVDHAAAAKFGVRFNSKETLGAEFLGSNGFYALLHRDSAQIPWREIAATSATPGGEIRFPDLDLRTGEYSLGVVQGISWKSNNSVIALGGQSLEGITTVTPGRKIRLGVASSAPGQKLTLVETLTGATWYRGPAEKLDISLFSLRAEELRFRAKFSGIPGVLEGTREFSLKADASKPALYPGLIVQIQRRTGESDAIPPAARPFQPDARWPREFGDTDYPAFRTAESIHTPPLGQAAAPWWSVPSYFHNILPGMSITPNANPEKGKVSFHGLTPDVPEVTDRRAFPIYPLGDLSAPFLSFARISGGILVDHPGNHQFRIECNLPGNMRLGDRDAAFNADISAGVSESGVLPFAMVVANSKATPQLRCRMFRKGPGESEFTQVPPSAFVHEVDACRARALAAATGNFAHRRAVLANSADDAAAAKLLESMDIRALVSDEATFETALRPLTDAFMKGRNLSGNPEVAMAACSLITARCDFLRANPSQLAYHGFAKTDGRIMALYESLLPFLSLCENHPELQACSLAARAELAQYAVATCQSRSFLSEEHHGANDGFSDNDNLIVNLQRAARCLDDPYAWDASTCLYDNHFRYAPGGGESLTADGIYTFHNVNGRQIHPMGYGSSWFNRILNRGLTGTPWGFTSEQYRRLARYHLANEWLFYQGTICWFANGRHNTHTGDAGWLAGVSDRLLNTRPGLLRPEDRKELEANASRVRKNAGNSISGNRFFHRNLYTVHRRPDYFIDVKMVSPIVGPSESFAGQVSWNMSFGDGVTTFMRSGKEFDGIHTNNGPSAAYGIATGTYKDPARSNQIPNLDTPCLWQFRALAGTTKLDDETFAPDRYRTGAGSTAGGVSDGELGHCAFQYALPTHGADSRKFYAFTDDGLFVMNSDVTTIRKGRLPTDVTLRSNINQCDWESDIRIVSQDGKQRILPHSGTDENLILPLDRRYWIEQDGIGYLILPTGCEAGPGKPGTLRIQAVTRTPLTPVPGTVYTPEQVDLIRKTVKPDRSSRVFHLWIDHGQQVSGAQCSYFVCMRAATADWKSWLASPPVEILANRTPVQSVRDRRDGTTHAFFREPGDLEAADGKLLFSTRTPASLMWRPKTHSLTAQDPVAGCTTDPSKMTDTLGVKLGDGLDGLDTTRDVTIDLPGMHDPDDRYRGEPVTRSVE